MMVVFDQPDADAPESISLAELAAVQLPKAVVAVASKAPVPRKSERTGAANACAPAVRPGEEAPQGHSPQRRR